MDEQKQTASVPREKVPSLSDTNADEPLIAIDEFLRIHLRVGCIVSAEAVPKSTKLLRVEIDTGDGKKQVVAGIANAYDPAILVGRTVVFVANLKPVTLMGVESNGMVLAATAPDGKPVLLTVDDPAAVRPGSGVQ